MVNLHIEEIVDGNGSHNLFIEHLDTKIVLCTGELSEIVDYLKLLCDDISIFIKGYEELQNVK